MVQLRKN